MKDKLLASLLSRSKGFIAPPSAARKSWSGRVVPKQSRVAPGASSPAKRMQGIMQSFAEESSQRPGRQVLWHGQREPASLHQGRESGEVSGPWLRLHQIPAPVYPVGPWAVTDFRLTFL